MKLRTFLCVWLWAWLWLLLLLPNPLRADSPIDSAVVPQVSFRSITTKEGLCSNYVLRMYQDSDGIMWIGTTHGLTRFDGMHYTTFLQSCIVTDLTEDRLGRLWIGTTEGLQLFDRNAGQLIPLPDGVPDSQKSINALLTDRQGFLWIYARGGSITKYNVAEARGQSVQLLDIDYIEGDYYYFTLREDSKGNVWCAGRSTPLICFRQGDFAGPLAGALDRDLEIASLCETTSGQIMAASSHLNSLFFPDSTLHRMEQPMPLPGDIIALVTDPAGTVWAGGKTGLFHCNNAGKLLTQYSANTEDPSSLISNRITTLFVDQDGQLWVGTQDGISISVPYKNGIQHFRKENVSGNALTDNRVTALLEDRDGLLWVGLAEDGVDTVNLASGRTGNLKYNLIGVPIDKQTRQREAYTLQQYALHGATKPQPENKVSVLYEDSDGLIYIGLWCHTGFNVYDKNKKIMRRYALWGSGELGNPYFLFTAQNPWGSNWYSGFLEDSRGRFWCATWERFGLNLFDRKKGQFKAQKDYTQSFFKIDLFTYSYLIPDAAHHRLWFGGPDGIFGYYDATTEQLHKLATSPLEMEYVNFPLLTGIYLGYYDIDLLAYKGRPIFTNTVSDARGHLYFVNGTSKLLQFDTATFSIKEIDLMDHVHYEIRGINLSYDKQALLLLTDHNILKISLSSFEQQPYFRSDETMKALMKDLDTKKVLHISLVETKKGNLLFGGFRQGLFCIRPGTEQPSSMDVFKDEAVYDIKEGENGSFWIGSDKGLSLLDSSGVVTRVIPEVSVQMVLPEGSTLFLGTTQGLIQATADGRIMKQYVFDPMNPYAIGSDRVRYVVRENDTTLWVSAGSKIQRFDQTTNRFYTINGPDDGYLAYRLASCLMENKRQEMWYGTTDNGLSIIDIPTGKITNHTHLPWDARSLPSKNVTTVFESANGTMWVGPDKGLSRYNRPENSFTHLPCFEGRKVCKIEEDASHRLWVSTTDGLLCYTPGAGVAPVPSATEAPAPSDSLRVFRRYLGFQGDEYSEASARLKDGRLAFGGNNGFSLFNPDQVYNIPANKPVVISNFQTESQYKYGVAPSSFSLEASENAFSFDFSATDYAFAPYLQYRYCLEGVDNEWHTAQAPLQTIRYTNVPGGKHTLWIQSSNALGEWTGTPQQWEITVAYPFYAKWWVILIEAFLLILTVIAVIKYRELKLRREKAALEQVVSERTADLSKELETKKRFLSIISHDIKNPVNATKSALQLLSQKYDCFSEEDRIQMISDIANTSYSTSELLHTLTMWVSSQMGSIVPQFDDVILRDVCADVIQIHALTAEIKDIRLVNDIPEGLTAYSDWNILATVLRNLLSNAIKFSFHHSQIGISAYAEANKVFLSVKDAGTGMDEETRSQLFTANPRSRAKGTDQEAGSGIGLMVVKELLQKLNCPITVTSSPGHGSCFTVELLAHAPDS